MDRNVFPTGSSHRAQSKASEWTEQEEKQEGASNAAKGRGRSRYGKYRHKHTPKRGTLVNVDTLSSWRDASVAQPVEMGDHYIAAGKTDILADVEVAKPEDPAILRKSYSYPDEKRSGNVAASNPEPIVRTNALMGNSKLTILTIPPPGFEAQVSDYEDTLPTAAGFYSRLATKLERYASVVHISIPSSDEQHEDMFEGKLDQPPSAVIIMNSDFYIPDHAASHHHLRRYLENGGTVIIISERHLTPNLMEDLYNCTLCMHSMGVFWNTTSFALAKIQVNERIDGRIYPTLPPTIDCNAIYLRHVEEQAAWYYRQVTIGNRTEDWRHEEDPLPLTPIAYKQIEQGYFGFIGGYHQRQEEDGIRTGRLDDIIFTMCKLQVEP